MENQEFLQSKEWINFQSAFGRKAHSFDLKKTHVNIIEHKLPLVGRYFYLPRGPLINKDEVIYFKEKIIKLASEHKAGWIRIEPKSAELLAEIKKKLSKPLMICNRGKFFLLTSQSRKISYFPK
jgi:lipid II:glycine glycyltransferase (peptidoglycan interpeptide bridge formation enzyme)